MAHWRCANGNIRSDTSRTASHGSGPERSTTIKGIAVFYPYQKPENLWDAKRLKVPAIEVFGGNLLVNGCNFQDQSSPQIALRGKDEDGEKNVQFVGNWHLATGKGFYYKGTRWAQNGKGEAKAVFTPNIPKTGRYSVYAWFGSDPSQDHARKAPVVVSSVDGTVIKYIDLRLAAGTWIKIGDYRFEAGRKGSITLSNDADGNVLADALKLLPI